MAANSLPRRIVKRVLHPLLSERNYRYFQAASMAWDIRRRSNWEPELELVPYVVREGEAALDIGANYGLWCYHLSHAAGRTGRVYAFEPVPFTAATLEVVLKLLRRSNVQIIPKGASDENRRVSFALPLQDSGAIAAGLAFIGTRDNTRAGHERHARFSATREVEAEVVRIDDALGPHVREVSFMKADIEGAELSAFRGAARLIERDRPTVVCEINPWFLEGFGVKLEDLLGFFRDRGYSLYFYDDRAGRLVPRTPEQIVDDNYVFVHPRRRDRLAALLD